MTRTSLIGARWGRRVGSKGAVDRDATRSGGLMAARVTCQPVGVRGGLRAEVQIRGSNRGVEAPSQPIRSSNPVQEDRDGY